MTLQQKIDKSISLIREYLPYAEMAGGYHVGFSGGKDSQCLYQLFKDSGVPFHAGYNVTTNDPPENVRFIRSQYPDVEFRLPKLNFFQLMLKKKSIPTMRTRFCCSYFKETVGTFKALGVRKEESVKRSQYHVFTYDNSRKIVDFSEYKGQKVRFYPILEWTEDDVWEYLDIKCITPNPLYDTFGRVGCMLCPYASKKQILYWFDLYPKLKVQFIKTITELMDGGYMRDFPNATPEDLLEWWMSKENAKMFFNQTKLDL